MPIGKKIDWKKFDNLIKNELPNYTIKEFTRKFLSHISPKAVGSRAKKLKIKPEKHKKTKNELKKLALAQMKETPEMVLYIKNTIDIKSRKEILENLKISHATLERIINRNNIKLSGFGRARACERSRLKNIGKRPWNKGKKLPPEMIEKIKLSNRKLGINDFIDKARKVHGNKYDYSKIEYRNAHTKVTIVCPEHGEFKQTPQSHSRYGCFECGKKKLSLTKNDFIQKSRKVHGDKYNYSKVEYKNRHTKVVIICPIHGEFEQTPNSHFLGYNCQKCAGNKKYTTKTFIEKAREIHGNKYDYSKVEYKSAHNKVTIICSEHGEFEQKPTMHLCGTGCLQCIKHSIRSFVSKSRAIHCNKYDYSKVDYENNKTVVTIVCSVHGDFEQLPSNHFKGAGCLKCAIKAKTSTVDEFIKKAQKVHNNKYDYSKVEYKNNSTKIIIICPKHGEFNQAPDHHLHGENCPNCSTIISSGHQEIIDFIESFDLEIKINDRKQINPYELDIYIPEKKLAIEYNGLFWHSYNENETTEERNKHKHKCELCEDKDIRLIQINENEWKNKQEIVKSVLKSKFGVSNRIFARKCEIKELDNQGYRQFIDKCHMQGYKGASVKLGLYYQDNLVSIMSFNKHPKYGWEITRFANKLNTTVVGGASRLFKYFIKKINPNQIMTFADRRYSDGNLYKKLGFEFVGYTSPNYSYIKNGIFSRQQFQKHKLKNKLEFFSQDSTEAENMFNNGYRRLWDAGHCKFLYQIKE